MLTRIKSPLPAAANCLKLRATGGNNTVVVDILKDLRRYLVDGLNRLKCKAKEH